jgi:hypothetical protein
MWKIGVVLGLMATMTRAEAGPRDGSHLEAITAKFPYGLLGDDHGVLTANDLAINACIATPRPFSRTSQSYPYWRCFPRRSSSFECHSARDADAETVIQVIVDREASERHEYLSRSGMSLETCVANRRVWRQLTNAQKYVCVSGAFIDSESSPNGGRRSYWIYDKFKTRRGCDSYFEGYCSRRAPAGNECRS